MSIKETFQKARETVKSRATLVSEDESYEEKQGSEMATIMVSDSTRGINLSNRQYENASEQKDAIQVEEAVFESKAEESILFENNQADFTKRHLLMKKVLRSGKVILSESDDDEETHFDFIEESHNKMRTQIVHLSKENQKLYRKNIVLMSYIQENGNLAANQSDIQTNKQTLAQRCSIKYNRELRKRINSKITRRIQVVLKS